MTPGTYVKLDEPTTVKINGEDVTFDENTWYGAIVQAQLDADGFPVTVWDAKNDTTDGWDAWYNPELAAQELALAVEDLAKLGYEVSKENPIVIDYPYPSYNEVGQNQAYVLKTCIEGALGGLVRFDALPLNDVTEFLNVENNTNSGAEHNTDMKEKAEIRELSKQIDGCDEKLKALETQKKQTIRENVRRTRGDRAFKADYKARHAALKARYATECTAEISDAMRRRNKLLAKDIYLSVSRYPAYKRGGLLHTLMYKCVAPEIVVCSSDMSIAELALRIAPVFIADTLDEQSLAALENSGIDIYIHP